METTSPLRKTEKLPRSAHSVVHLGWSPQELQTLAPMVNPLEPSQSDIQIPTTLTDRISSSSGLGMDFERLRHVFDPRSDQTESIGFNDSATRLLCTEAGTVTVPADLATRMARILDPLNLFSSESQDDGKGGRQGTVEEQLFKITSEFAGSSKLVVQRSQSHVFAVLRTFLRCFPHIMIPVVNSAAAVQLHHIDMLFEAISLHSREVQRFLPLLFFLFEENDRYATNFFGGLLDHIRSAEESDEAAFVERQKSGIFKWAGSTPAKVQPLKRDDELEHVARNGKSFPFRFQDWLAASHAENTAASQLEKASNVLYACLEEEIAAAEDFCTSLVEMDVSEKNYRWLEEDAENTGVDQSKAVVAGFLGGVRMQHQHVSLPLVSMMNTAVKSFSSRCNARNELGRRMVGLHRWLQQRSEGINKRSGQELREMTGVIEKKQGQLEALHGGVLVEDDSARKHMIETLQKLCVYVCSATHHLADPFESRHYVEFSSRFGLESSDGLHPVLSAFKAFEGQGPCPSIVDDGFSIVPLWDEPNAQLPEEATRCGESTEASPEAVQEEPASAGEHSA